MSGRIQKIDQQPPPKTNIRHKVMEMATLRWNLVQRSRQNWTCISLAVVAACAWLLARSHPGIQGTPLAWATGAVSVMFCIGWALGQHYLARTHRRLNTLQSETGCHERYPMLRLITE